MSLVQTFITGSSPKLAYNWLSYGLTWNCTGLA